MEEQGVVTNAIVPVSAYQKAYGFTPVPAEAPLEERIDEMRAKVKSEPFKIRRQMWQTSLRTLELEAQLGADFIQLPIFRCTNLYQNLSWRQPYAWEIVRHHVFAGGLERYETVVTYQDWDNLRRGALSYERYRALYTGELPNWVYTKYQRAAELLGKDRLLVISRDPNLFQFEERQVVTPPQLSPLLLGMPPGENQDASAASGLTDLSKLYLIAAWGLEHELEEQTE